MKEKIVLFFVMMMFMLCVGAYAENLIYYQDSTATETLRMIPVSDITPLPISGVVNIGSATIEAGSPPSENITVVVSVSAVAFWDCCISKLFRNDLNASSIST